MRFRILLSAACVAASAASATPQSRDATNMWFDPDEPGWGFNVIHQGDTLFGTLFVYGSDGQPKWFVASDMKGDGRFFNGALSECAGPWFGGPFAPGAASCREVGPISFDSGGSVGVIAYTVDGIRVSKMLQRFTFRRTTLQGVYEGYIIQPASSLAPEVRKDDLTLQVTEEGSSILMESSSDSQSPCTWRGQVEQRGEIETIGGAYQCPGRSGTWTMGVDVTTEGFTGVFSGDGITSGRIAAARVTGDVRMQGTGWRNDMWFVPAESGWGLNVIEQGDTLFATLFVYDAQRRPRWYVASSLVQGGDRADGRVTYSGLLYESTGPYFGTAFNPSAVTRREVGRMYFQANPDGSGLLNYTVDGVEVIRENLQRFAFRKQGFTGSYLGSYAHDRQAVITIDDEGPEFRMRLVDRFGGMGTCDFVAPFEQAGSLRVMSGTYACGPRSGSFVMRHATVSASGFTARFDSPMFGFRSIADGHIAGVRR